MITKVDIESSKTESEILFEMFCSQKGIECNPIPTKSDEKVKTPDYEICINSQKIIAEIKQIDPNKEDIAQKKISDASYGSITTIGITPGSRVRSKINAGAKQLRAFVAENKHPTILVLYNNVILTNYTDSYHIRVAMYGFETYVIGVPKETERDSYLIDKKFGPNQRMTKQHNTVISAVASLLKDNNGVPTLHIYHNEYADEPLSVEMLRLLKIKQFKLAPKNTSQFQEWIEI